jgi:precorrin-6A/cobalt-precorrin-6A reductase
MTARGRVLVFGGSTEASQLARRLSERHPDVKVVMSFAGRTSVHAPTPKGVDARVGGFGGVEGLRAYVLSGRFDAVVDATHPFAARMPFHVRAMCDEVGTPAVRLIRPPWAAAAGDQWVVVPDMTAAAAAVERALVERVLLTIGRQELGPFGRCRSTAFVIRSIEAPAAAELAAVEVILARGPFTLDDERALLRSRRIEMLVSKNSGGSATRAKIDAARELGIPIVMVGRPRSPSGQAVRTVDDAEMWLITQLARVTA